MKITTLIVFTFTFLNLFGQSVINGIVLDEKTPFPYVKVYLNNHKIGTLTNFEGKFELTNKSIPFSEKDTFVVESNGFETEYIPFQSGKVFYEVNLQKKITQLNEIVVGPLYPITRELNKFEKESELKYQSYLIQPFEEHAILIENLNLETGIVKNISVFIPIYSNQKAPFRVNFYSANIKTGIPEKIILSTDIIEYPKVSKKWQKIELEKYNIILPKNGLFVSIEALPFEEGSLRNNNLSIDSIKNNLSESKNEKELKSLSLGFYYSKNQTHYIKVSKEGVNWSANDVNKWVKISNKAPQIGLKIELKVYSKTKNLKALNSIDTSFINFDKKQSKQLDLPKIDYNNFPQNTLKELLESSVKAYNNNQLTYWFSNLLIAPNEEKAEFLEILESIQISEKNGAKNKIITENNIFLIIQNLLDNFDDLILSEYENNIFRLKSDEGNYPFIVINGKWYFYVDAFETKSDIKHFNFNIEEH